MLNRLSPIKGKPSVLCWDNRKNALQARSIHQRLQPVKMQIHWKEGIRYWRNYPTGTSFPRVGLKGTQRQAASVAQKGKATSQKDSRIWQHHSRGLAFFFFLGMKEKKSEVLMETHSKVLEAEVPEARQYMTRLYF